MLNALSMWLEHTRLSMAIVGYPWVWAVLETFHFIGMALLIGVIGFVDLRLMGVVKGFPVAPLQEMLPWGIAGFCINVISGALFFIGIPHQYIHNSAFALKLLFMLLAGINVLVFNFALAKKVNGLGPGEDMPLSARLIGATSLFLWFGVAYWGRMLPYIGNSY